MDITMTRITFADGHLHSESIMIVSLGVGRESAKYVNAIRDRGLSCNDCGDDIFEFEHYDDFKSAAGCGLCAICYEFAGEENAHSDGHHDDAPSSGCLEYQNGSQA
jgi:hypothetical protein